MSDTPEDFTSDVELFPGTLRGYRYWRVNRYCEDWTPLTGVSVESFTWKPRGNHARCVYLDHHGAVHPEGSIPSTMCQCGFYAWYEPEGAIQNHRNARMGLDGDIVLGVIEASGLIIPGSKGFRAEKADIVALMPGKMQITGYSGVPLLSSVDDLIQEYPPQEVTWKKPEAPARREPYYAYSLAGASWMQNVINQTASWSASWTTVSMLASIPSCYPVSSLTAQSFLVAMSNAKMDNKNPTHWVMNPSHLTELSKTLNVTIANGASVFFLGCEVFVDYTVSQPYLVAE